MEKRYIWSLLLVILLLVSASCSLEQDQDAAEGRATTREVGIDTLYRFTSYETDDLAGPASLDVMPEGNIAVVDYQLKQVRIYDPEGELQSFFGGEGRGPGEFVMPMYIQSTDTALWVMDQRINKFTAFTPDGSYLTDFTFRAAVMVFEAIPAGRHSYYASTGGEGGVLIKHTDILQDSTTYIGEAMGDAEPIFNPQIALKEAASGEIPSVYRNLGVVRFDGDFVYLFLRSYHRLQKYTPDGELLWDLDITLPENEVIFDSFVDLSKRQEAGVPVLRHIVDMKLHDGRVFLLWRKVDGHLQKLVQVNREGQIETIYTLPQMEEVSFNGFALSPDGRTLYLASTGIAAIFQAELIE